MSRFAFDNDEYDPLAAGRWEWNLEQAIKGKRGQKALRELEEALLSMPQRRLIASELATPSGEVCTLGCAVAARRVRSRGLTWDSAVRSLVAEDKSWDGFEQATEDDPLGDYFAGEWFKVEYPDWHLWSFEAQQAPSRLPNRVSIGRVTVREPADDDVEDSTIAVGWEAGFVGTLAAQIGYVNDQEYKSQTPEERWKLMLKWVRSRLVPGMVLS